MFIKYNKRMILWTLLLCLGTTPVMAVIGEDEEENLIYVPGSVPISHRLFAPWQTEEERWLMAVSGFKQSVLEAIAEASPEIRYAAALKLAQSKTPEKRQKGGAALRAIANDDTNRKKVPAAVSLAERGDKKFSIWRTVEQSAEQHKDNPHWKPAALTLLKNEDYAQKGREAVTAALQYLVLMKLDDTRVRNARQVQLIKDTRDVLDFMEQSKIELNRNTAKILKNSENGKKLYGFREKLKGKIKEKLTPKKSN